MRGTCKNCGRTNMSLPAQGLCGKCYDVLHPPHTRKSYKRTQNAALLPVKKTITIWETSDGKEWGNETDALRHQIELNYNGRRNK